MAGDGLTDDPYYSSVTPDPTSGDTPHSVSIINLTVWG